jgi:hypothetical protein
VPTDLKVVRGQPTAEELAAVVVVLTGARQGRTAPAPHPRPSLWAARQVRPAMIPGPGAWRGSGLPGRV